LSLNRTWDRNQLLVSEKGEQGKELDNSLIKFKRIIGDKVRRR